MMMDETVCCPSCGRCGYPTGTATAEPHKFIAVMCITAACVLDRDGLAKCRRPGEAAAPAPKIVTRPGPKLLR